MWFYVTGPRLATGDYPPGTVIGGDGFGLKRIVKGNTLVPQVAVLSSKMMWRSGLM